ncbi:DUF805 domain-containing protein [Roseinatronobacter monicus]|uniref:DUF805 domain-containing protein n=1 Tax=Roseinatronobacter monicus TaxID=393481 RepID=UPI003F3B4FAC
MTFTDAVKSGFENSLNFSGRSRRPEYWWFFLFVFAGAFALALVQAAMGMTGNWLVRLFQLVTFVPFLAVGWRRLQDTGRPGWYLVVPVVIVVISSLMVGSLSANMMQGGFGDMHQAGRMHGQTGIVALLAVAQFIAGVVIIWWMTRRSQRGDNKFGPEPRFK